jgi:methionyl aminopeptidase
MSLIKTTEDLKNLRFSCLIAASAHYHLKSFIKPGMSGKQIDDWVTNFGASYGASPSFHSNDFPYTINFSIDNEVTHALPLPTRFVPENCVLKIDLGFEYKGMHSDRCDTYIVGKVTQAEFELVATCKDALWAGIHSVKAGCVTGDIGFAVDSVAKKHGYGNVYELGGHGIAYTGHASPFIPHHGKKGKGVKLFKNQVITIEPMFNLGSGEVEFDKTAEDGWTIRTKDGSTSAQWEHEILVTETGCEVLTDIPDKDILPII